MPTTTQQPTASTADEVFARAVALIQTELGGVLIDTAAVPEQFPHERIRARKLALAVAVRRDARIPRLTDAYRIVDAAFGHLTADGHCTADAAAAVAHALYGGAADVRGRTGARLRATAHDLLTTALAG